MKLPPENTTVEIRDGVMVVHAPGSTSFYPAEGWKRRLIRETWQRRVATAFEEFRRNSIFAKLTGER